MTVSKKDIKDKTFWSKFKKRWKNFTDWDTSPKCKKCGCYLDFDINALGIDDYKCPFCDVLMKKIESGKLSEDKVNRSIIKLFENNPQLEKIYGITLEELKG